MQHFNAASEGSATEMFASGEASSSAPGVQPAASEPRASLASALDERDREIESVREMMVRYLEEMR